MYKRFNEFARNIQQYTRNCVVDRCVVGRSQTCANTSISTTHRYNCRITN